MYIAIWNDGHNPDTDVIVATGEEIQAVRLTCEQEASEGEEGTYRIYDAKLVESALIGGLKWVKEMPF